MLAAHRRCARRPRHGMDSWRQIATCAVHRKPHPSTVAQAPTISTPALRVLAAQ